MKVSVLTTCYNYGVFTREAAKSVSKQTYGPYEMIIVDDCSSASSWEKIRNLDKTYSFVKTHRNRKRLGCGGSYAKALSMATGDICVILDGDDQLFPDAIASVVKKYKSRKDISYIYSNYYNFDPTMTIQKRKGVSCLPLPGLSIAESYLQDNKHCFSHMRTFRRKISKKGILFPTDLQTAVDKNLGFALEELGYGGFLSKTLYKYRIHKQNMTHTNRKQKSTGQKLAAKYIKRREVYGKKTYKVYDLG